MQSTITTELTHEGDKHVITISATGLEDVRVEFDTEEEARAALARALDRSTELCHEGMVESIDVSYTPRVR